MEYNGSHRYQVVFVDEYNNWWLCGFYDNLAEALPDVNAYLRMYQLEDPEEGQEGPIWLGPDSPFWDLTEYASTCGPCLDATFSTPEGTVEVRGFVYA